MVKYQFIKEHAKEFSIQVMCKVLSVSRGGFYAFEKRSISDAEIKRNALDSKISHIYTVHKGNYGSPRITKELHGLGINCSKNTVSKRMREMNLKAKHKRKFKVTTDSKHNLPVAENILARDFSATDINQNRNVLVIFPISKQMKVGYILRLL